MEETNSEIKVGNHLAAIEDLNNIVHLYSAEIINSKQFTPNKEITELKWLDIKEFITEINEENENESLLDKNPRIIMVLMELKRLLDDKIEEFKEKIEDEARLDEFKKNIEE